MLSTVQRITDPPDETKAGSLISVRGNLRRSSIPFDLLESDRLTILPKIKKTAQGAPGSAGELTDVARIFAYSSLSDGICTI
jgi:hypothetical protein